MVFSGRLLDGDVVNRNGQTEELVDRLTSSASTFLISALGPTNDTCPEMGISKLLAVMSHGGSEAYHEDSFSELFGPSVGDTSLLHSTCTSTR